MRFDSDLYPENIVEIYRVIQNEWLFKKKRSDVYEILEHVCKSHIFWKLKLGICENTMFTRRLCIPWNVHTHVRTCVTILTASSILWIFTCYEDTMGKQIR